MRSHLSVGLAVALHDPPHVLGSRGSNLLAHLEVVPNGVELECVRCDRGQWTDPDAAAHALELCEHPGLDDHPIPTWTPKSRSSVARES